MADITYQIQFHSFWHAGSGLSGGVIADNLVFRHKLEQLITLKKSPPMNMKTG